MATLSPSPPLILLLQLLFLTTTAAPINDICRKTKNPSGCVDFLITFDPRCATAPLPELEELVIDAATGATRQVKNRFSDLYSRATEPNLRRVYGNCDKLYSGAVGAIVGSKQYLKQRHYAKIVEAAGVVGRAVAGCTTAAGKSGGLKGDNDNVGVLGEAIALIARSLH